MIRKIGIAVVALGAMLAFGVSSASAFIILNPVKSRIIYYLKFK
jgi:hypothetical protein